MAGSAGSEWSWGPAEEDEGLSVMLAAGKNDDEDDKESDDDDLDDDDLDDDELDDDDDDDDLTDLDDEYDDADEDEKPHPGKFDE